MSATPPPPGDQEPVGDLTAVVPTLIKLGALTWWRTTEAAAEASVRGGRRIVRAARHGENPADLIQELGANTRDTARRVLGVDGAHGETPREQQNGREPTLRDRGSELLRRSADVTYDEKYHPAYERMLSELAPDEARVLTAIAEGPGGMPAGLLEGDAADAMAAYVASAAGDG